MIDVVQIYRVNIEMVDDEMAIGVDAVMNGIGRRKTMRL
jgi:hypothetical protein